MCVSAHETLRRHYAIRPWAYLMICKNINKIIISIPGIKITDYIIPQVQYYTMYNHFEYLLISNLVRSRLFISILTVASCANNNILMTKNIYCTRIHSGGRYKYVIGRRPKFSKFYSRISE